MRWYQTGGNMDRNSPLTDSPSPNTLVINEGPETVTENYLGECEKEEIINKENRALLEEDKNTYFSQGYNSLRKSEEMHASEMNNCTLQSCNQDKLYQEQVAERETPFIPVPNSETPFNKTIEAKTTQQPPKSNMSCKYYGSNLQSPPYKPLKTDDPREYTEYSGQTWQTPSSGLPKIQYPYNTSQMQVQYGSQLSSYVPYYGQNSQVPLDISSQDIAPYDPPKTQMYREYPGNSLQMSSYPSLDSKPSYERLLYYGQPQPYGQFSVSHQTYINYGEHPQFSHSESNLFGQTVKKLPKEIAQVSGPFNEENSPPTKLVDTQISSEPVEYKKKSENLSGSQPLDKPQKRKRKVRTQIKRISESEADSSKSALYGNDCRFSPYGSDMSSMNYFNQACGMHPIYEQMYSYFPNSSLPQSYSTRQSISPYAMSQWMHPICANGISPLSNNEPFPTNPSPSHNFCQHLHTGYPMNQVDTCYVPHGSSYMNGSQPSQQTFNTSGPIVSLNLLSLPDDVYSCEVRTKKVLQEYNYQNANESSHQGDWKHTVTSKQYE